MNRLDTAVDGSSAKLLAVVQAAVLDGTLPRESGRQLVNLAKAVRAYALAYEYELARGCLAPILEALDSDEAPRAALLKTALEKHCARVERALFPRIST